MRSFLDTHRASDWYDQINSLNYATLRKLNSNSDDKIGCLKPICRSPYPIREKRKAEVVQALIGWINAGGTLSQVGDVCACENLKECVCSD